MADAEDPSSERPDQPDADRAVDHPPVRELAELANPLRVEDDEYEVADEVAMVAVRWSSSLDEARVTARELIECGLGATVTPVPAAGGPTGYEVRVLPTQVERAGDVLAGSGATDTGMVADAAVSPERPPVPWRSVLLIWLAAMIVVPLVAGVATYLLLR